MSNEFERAIQQYKAGSEADSRRVIVEELLHLQVPNHGKLFRALLRACLEEEE